MHNLPGEWYPDMGQIKLDERSHPNLFGEKDRFSLWNALTHRECRSLIKSFLAQKMQAVSVSGFVTGSHEVGSMRATAWSPELADTLWGKWKPEIQKHIYSRTMNDYTATDWYAMPATDCALERQEHRYWKPVGISPVLRFMKYEQGGEHNTHYDMGYDYWGRDPNDPRRTLMSFVVYLTTCAHGTGGGTRFIEDGQGAIPTALRNHDDWSERARLDQVTFASRPVEGKVLFFDHRMAHDVEPYTGSTPRIIIRGDLIFQAASLNLLTTGS